jgi:hypothetical protein
MGGAVPQGDDGAEKRRPVMRALLAIACLGLAAFADAPHLVPAAGLLATWTAALQQRQPDDAFVAVYQSRHHRLVFVAAEHSNSTASKTFQLIDATFAAYRFDTAILEGFSTSRGANPAALLDEVLASKPKNGFAEEGETYPAMVGATAQRATIWGGEPDDADVKAYARAKGISEADLLGFYTLRSIPQWIRERKLIDAADPRLVALIDAELDHNRRRLALDGSILPSFAGWARWYAATNHRPIGASFDDEEAGPRVDGPYPSNKIAAAVAEARDAHLHRLIVAHLDANESVIVVYGGSHLMIQRPALDAVLGPPCYFGDAIATSRKSCHVE